MRLGRQRDAVGEFEDAMDAARQKEQAAPASLERTAMRPLLHLALCLGIGAAIALVTALLI